MPCNYANIAHIYESQPNIEASAHSVFYTLFSIINFVHESCDYLFVETMGNAEFPTTNKNTPLKSSFLGSQNNIILSGDNVKQPTKEKRPTWSTQCGKKATALSMLNESGKKPQMNSWYALITFAGFSSLNFANRKMNEKLLFFPVRPFLCFKWLCTDCFLALRLKCSRSCFKIYDEFFVIFFFFNLKGMKSLHSCSRGTCMQIEFQQTHKFKWVVAFLFVAVSVLIIVIPSDAFEPTLVEKWAKAI